MRVDPIVGRSVTTGVAVGESVGVGEELAVGAGVIVGSGVSVVVARNVLSGSIGGLGSGFCVLQALNIATNKRIDIPRSFLVVCSIGLLSSRKFRSCLFHFRLRLFHLQPDM